MIFLFYCSLLLLGCQPNGNSQSNGDHSLEESDSTIETQKSEFFNIIILLDLSDRIFNPNQVKRDKEIINSIFDLFETRQKRLGYISSRDRLTITVASQKDSELDLLPFKDNLQVIMNRKMTRKNFEAVRKDFLQTVDDLYNNAIQNKTTGADLWSFVGSKLESYIKAPTEKIIFRNKLIILSDGYLVFDKEISAKRPNGTTMSLQKIREISKMSNWNEVIERDKNNYNLQPHEGQNFENLQVLMLEITPFEQEINVFEGKILNYIWENWFNSMGVEFFTQEYEKTWQISRKVLFNS